MHAQQKTATIYQFPVHARTNMGRSRLETRRSAELRALSMTIPDVAGWYHQAAIEDARRGKH